MSAYDFIPDDATLAEHMEIAFRKIKNCCKANGSSIADCRFCLELLEEDVLQEIQIIIFRSLYNNVDRVNVLKDAVRKGNQDLEKREKELEMIPVEMWDNKEDEVWNDL